MKCDCFTISRYVFLLFLVIVAVYFLIENKKVEGFAEEAAKPSAPAPAPSASPAASKPTTLAPAPSTAPAPAVSKQTAPAPATPAAAKAPEGASTEGLSNKKANDTPVAGKDPVVFLSKDPKTMEAEVVKIYQELYKVNPQAEEVGFYIDYAKSRDITRAALKEVISTSAPTLKKTLMKNQQVNDGLMDLVGTEKDVISIFNEILQRNPDREELYQFSRMLKNDGGFNRDKLRQVLLTSEEYQRMERTQTNTAFVSLQGDITDRQVTMIVYKLHKEVSGKEFIDEETLHFLKRKFIEFKLDEAHMKKFIENYIAGKPAPPAPAPTDAAAKKAAEEAAAKKVAEAAAAKKAADDAAAKAKAAEAAKVPGAKETSKDAKETFGQVTNFPSDGKNYITNSVFILGGTDRPNSELLASLSKSAGAGSSVDTNKVLQTIKDNAAASAAADKNAAKSQSQVQLSKFMEERNRDEMKSVCQRNTYFRDVDELMEPVSHEKDMVLRPEFKWAVPQRHPPVCMGNNSAFSPLMTQSALIGTPLDEAAETKVGSILPKNPPV